MSNLSDFLGVSKRYNYNPKLLPIISAPKAALVLKTGLTTTALLSTAGGFTAMALRGATASIASAGVYVTVGTLSGAGFAFNFVSPTHDVGTHIPTIRITVDGGTPFVIAPTVAQILGNRICIGAVTKSASVTATGSAMTAGDYTGPNAAYDDGFGIANIGGVQGVTSATALLALLTPHTAMCFGLPALRFETSLLVEMKCDSLSGTAVDKQCGFTYLMDL